jgi:hypothetical protein
MDLREIEQLRQETRLDALADAFSLAMKLWMRNHSATVYEFMNEMDRMFGKDNLQAHGTDEMRKRLYPDKEARP